MYAWGDNRRFNSYSGYFRRMFGCRVQKLSVDAGFTCPNRDGTISGGGCTFCNNGAFTPSYCVPAKGVRRQIEEGIEFHRRRYRTASKYLVYFQSFSNTYAPLERLKEVYGEALAHPDVAGIVVGTRPDCVDAEKLDYFAELARGRYVAVEYGIESTRDETLRAVNRGHDFACARRAVEMTAARGLHVGAHFILGLPGETDAMLLEQVAAINSLPLTTLKFHQLQLFRGTTMAAEYDADPGSLPLLGDRRVHRPFRRGAAPPAARSGRRAVRERGAAPLPLRPQLGAGAQRTAAGDARKKIGGTKCVSRRNFCIFTVAVIGSDRRHRGNRQIYLPLRPACTMS